MHSKSPLIHSIRTWKQKSCNLVKNKLHSIETGLEMTDTTVPKVSNAMWPISLGRIRFSSVRFCTFFRIKSVYTDFENLITNTNLVRFRFFDFTIYLC